VAAAAARGIIRRVAHAPGHPPAHASEVPGIAMTEYSLLLVAHLVLFAYWLGGDIGVFYSSYQVCNPSLSKEARSTALKIMMWVDMVPRYCLVLMLPVGVSLAATLGFWRTQPGLVAVLWVLAGVWLWMVWAIHHHQGKPLAETLRRIDLGIRVLVILAMLGAGVAGFAGHGPINQPWLAVKAILFALLVFSGLMIRVMIAPFGPALVEIMTKGSTPDAEARLDGAMSRARPFVVMIWIGLVAMAYFGALKPALG
jgi:hypothetical protein